MSAPISGCDFEVFGVVQGVYFRKHTHEHASKLGLTGWCMNTLSGSVKGHMEGKETDIKQMQYWLKKVGSPKSKIESAIFTPIEFKTKPDFSKFTIKRKLN